MAAASWPAILSWLMRRWNGLCPRASRGPMFCEWGSGFGVITMLASMLGFEAYGIEVQSELVLAAEELANDFSCDVRFAHGSFVSSQDSDLTASAEHSWWHDDDGTSYEDLDLEPQDFDVFFAYPWPGEEPLFEALFLRYASDGAILLTYHDTSGVLVQRRASGQLERVGWY